MRREWAIQSGGRPANAVASLPPPARTVPPRRATIFFFLFLVEFAGDLSPRRQEEEEDKKKKKDRAGGSTSDFAGSSSGVLFLEEICLRFCFFVVLIIEASVAPPGFLSNLTCYFLLFFLFSPLNFKQGKNYQPVSGA